MIINSFASINVGSGQVFMSNGLKPYFGKWEPVPSSTRGKYIQEPYLSNSMATHGSLSLKRLPTLSSFHQRKLDKKGRNWTCYSYICIDLNTLHIQFLQCIRRTIQRQQHSHSPASTPWHWEDGTMAGRGLGQAAPWGPPKSLPWHSGPRLSQSPHSRQPEYRLQGERMWARKGCPTLSPARTGTSSLLHWTQFPLHPRAGLVEAMCRSPRWEKQPAL